MGLNVEFVFGPRFSSDNTPESPWLGMGASQVAHDVWGRYAEIARRGLVFSASCAAVALGTAFTTTPPISVWNPSGSNKYISILKSHLNVTTVQTTVNTVAYGAVNAQATKPTGGAAAVPQSALIGSTITGIGQAFSASTLTAAPTLVGSAFQLSSGGTASSALTTCVTDWVEGSMLLLPGSAMGMQGVTAAGTGSGIITVYWAEIPFNQS